VALDGAGPDPLFTLFADDEAWLGGLRAFWSRSRRWHVQAGLELRAVDVASRMESLSFADPVIGRSSDPSRRSASRGTSVS